MREGMGAFLRDEQGTTAIEYALIGTLVGVACIVAFQRYSNVTSVLYAIITATTSYL